MDNQTRSELSRKKAIAAALAILTRDGVGALTFDSLSRESGISKGGLLHQFRTKQGVLQALLEHQRGEFIEIAADYMNGEGRDKAEPTLASQIAIFRHALNQPDSVARAMLAVMVESPQMLEGNRDGNEEVMQAIGKEAVDHDLSLIRYFAASGMAFHLLMGLTELDEATRHRLFGRLLDDESWKALQAKKKAAR
ncbi:TetR/AcrR family transcriptional regulator [Paraburkholderia sp. Ac-20340]|uniref:TetR/AcrR family transcriptional regulator n=1 Tax=Paraburkholderia sp. Ac-20340 TaxID=2703888 RepID=UPI00197EA319|nr:TetR family transcriptional regulator [Paraburkholderia sp. Ac-20340]MBN3853664.1 TetR/AcrR family transcriptional regulator [Paraburkholderia sp. Ac-20340]